MSNQQKNNDNSVLRVSNNTTHTSKNMNKLSKDDKSKNYFGSLHDKYNGISVPNSTKLDYNLEVIDVVEESKDAIVTVDEQGKNRFKSVLGTNVAATMRARKRRPFTQSKLDAKARESDAREFAALFEIPDTQTMKDGNNDDLISTTITVEEKKVDMDDILPLGKQVYMSEEEKDILLKNTFGKRTVDEAIKLEQQAEIKAEFDKENPAKKIKPKYRKITVNGQSRPVMNETINFKLNRKDKSSQGCFTGDTMILTLDGLQPVKDLLKDPFIAIVDGKYYASRECFKEVDVQKVFRVELDNDLFIRVGENQKVLLQDGVTFKAVKDLVKNVDQVRMSINTGFRWENDHGTFQEGYLMGQIIGDGTFFVNNLKQDCPQICLWLSDKYKNDVESYDPFKYIQDYVRTLKNDKKFKGFCYHKEKWDNFDKYSLQCKSLRMISEKFGLKRGNKFVPENGSVEFTRGLISGFFDADGTVGGTQEKGISVRLSQTDLLRLRAVQRLLLALGIYSKIFKDRVKAGEKLYPDGHGGRKMYKFKDGHELIIANDSMKRFQDLIGFKDNDKREKLRSGLSKYKRTMNRSKYFSEVVSIAEEKEEVVYSCLINKSKCVSANGIVSRN